MFLFSVFRLLSLHFPFVFCIFFCFFFFTPFYLLLSLSLLDALFWGGGTSFRFIFPLLLLVDCCFPSNSPLMYAVVLFCLGCVLYPVILRIHSAASCSCPYFCFHITFTGFVMFFLVSSEYINSGNLATISRSSTNMRCSYLL